MTARNLLAANFKVVTPVFCAGADQNGPAEIRPFSLRGALRWWYRAIDSDYRTREADFFGAAGRTIKASPVTLRLGNWVSGSSSYKKQLEARKATERGDAYLGYTLYLSKNDRKAVPENTPVNIELIERAATAHIRRAWAASLWLFGHLGGLGTRARRGYGTMALADWSGWPECNELLPAHGAKTPGDWQQAFNNGLRKIRTWFKAPTAASHHHIGETVKPYIWRDGFADWQGALHAAGSEFQAFRREPDNHRPELLAAFGLPIRFRKHQAQFAQPRGFHRAPSRLQFRAVVIAGKYHPLVWRSDGPLLPTNQRLKYQGNYAADQPSDKLLDGFLARIKPLCAV